MNSISYVGLHGGYVYSFGELTGVTGTNIEIDLSLRKYMYNVLYINQHAIQVPYYFRRISILLKICNIIIALCDGMLHLIDNQSTHSNLQDYDPNVRVFINYSHTVFQSKTVHFSVLFILFAFHCETYIIREDIRIRISLFRNKKISDFIISINI